MDNRLVKENLYHDFLKIREMKASFQTKHRMLWEMLSMSGKNKDFWLVVGITELAFNKMVENDTGDAKKNIKKHRIQRAHIKKRIDTSREMLEGPSMDLETWWKFYKDNDKCVLATASENHRKDPEIIKYKVPRGLFECSGFSFKVGKEEIEFLERLYYINFKAEEKKLIDSIECVHDIY
tara:strand:+ start:690 stop:1229 length:540 start_codon:yes stop_codon:yes gene_type:complete